MLVLALDTSSRTLSCALVELPSLRVLVESVPEGKQGDLLPGALLSLCDAAGVKLADVGGLAVGVGPGSFTGLRVGLAAAKAIAYARKLPLAGASSLRALALGAGGSDSRQIVPTLEARKAELYALIDGTELAYRARELVAKMNERSFAHPPLLIGPGAAACRAELLAAGAPEAWLGDPGAPLAKHVAALCAAELEGGRYDQAAVFALGPNYVKPSEAEVALGEGRVGGLPGSGSSVGLKPEER